MRGYIKCSRAQCRLRAHGTYLRAHVAHVKRAIQQDHALAPGFHRALHLPHRSLVAPSHHHRRVGAFLEYLARCQCLCEREPPREERRRQSHRARFRLEVHTHIFRQAGALGSYILALLERLNTRWQKPNQYGRAVDRASDVWRLVWAQRHSLTDIDSIHLNRRVSHVSRYRTYARTA